MAVAPPVGPSTIAPPKAGGPVPSVNNSTGEGATTGHPGVALLLARLGGQNSFDVYCSGTLIRQNVILTAAHCMCWSPDPTSNYANGTECVQGNQAVSKPPSELNDPGRWLVYFQHVGIRKVSQVIVNEGYRFGNAAVRHDLALLVLEQPVREIN